MRAFLAALCMLACTAATARTFTVDDLLRVESYGQALIVGDRDLLVVERRGPYAGAADFGYDTFFTSRMVGRVLAASLRRPGRLVPLFAQDRRAGYWIGTPSPGHTRLTVFRLQDRRLSLGVVDLRTRAVRWLHSAPDLPAANPQPSWVDEDHLAFVAMARPRLPASLMMGTAGAADVADLWRRQARGEPTRTIVSTASGADPDRGVRRLVVASLGNGAERTLAVGAIVDLALSPSRRHVALVLAGVPVTPPRGPIDVGFDSRRHHVAVITLASGRRADAPGDVLGGVMSWSADDRLLVAARSGGSTWDDARWLSIRADGRVEALGGPDARAEVRPGPNGPSAFGAWAGGSAIGLVRIGTSPAGWARLAPGAAAPVALPAASRPVGKTSRSAWMLDGSHLYAVGVDGVRPVVGQVLAANPAVVDPYSLGYRPTQFPDELRSVTIATPRGAVVRQVGADGLLLGGMPIPAGAQVVAADDRRMLVLARDRRAVTSLALLGVGQTRREVDRINRRFSGIELPRAVDLGTTARDGTSLHDWLLLPPGVTGKVPLIVNPYPGLVYGPEPPPEAGIGRYAISDNPLLLTSAGYAVLLPSMPRDPDVGWADAILPRIASATEAAVATGLVDPARVGLQGHSFGAYAAMVVATRSSRFGAVVAANGPYDLIATHGAMPYADKLRFDYGLPAGSSAGWTEGGQADAGLLTATDLAFYAAASPMLHLDAVHSPVLLIAGDLDLVDVGQSERAFMELYRRGKDARLARYWGENHTNASPANIRDYWRLAIGFFDEHLKGAAVAAALPGDGWPIARKPLTRSRHRATPRSSRGGSARGSPGCRTAPRR